MLDESKYMYNFCMHSLPYMHQYFNHIKPMSEYTVFKCLDMHIARPIDPVYKPPLSYQFSKSFIHTVNDHSVSPEFYITITKKYINICSASIISHLTVKINM